jgi:hypothetical protein
MQFDIEIIKIKIMGRKKTSCHKPAQQKSEGEKKINLSRLPWGVNNGS